MSDTVKQFTVIDGNGHSMPVAGYQAANQLVQKYLDHSEVAVIVIRVTKMIPSDSRKESNPIYVNKCSEFK